MTSRIPLATSLQIIPSGSEKFSDVSYCHRNRWKTTPQVPHLPLISHHLHVSAKLHGLNTLFSSFVLIPFNLAFGCQSLWGPGQDVPITSSTRVTPTCGRQSPSCDTRWPRKLCADIPFWLSQRHLKTPHITLNSWSCPNLSSSIKPSLFHIPLGKRDHSPFSCLSLLNAYLHPQCPICPSVSDHCTG